VNRAANKSPNPFDEYATQYDAWFASPEGCVLFENELAAIRFLWCQVCQPALEVGVGTGRFAQALNVEFGIDPAVGSLRLAERRGIKVNQARGEAIPFPDATFGGVLMVATLCFADDAATLFREAARVLRSDGHLLVGDVPADSPWGKEDLRKKETGHPFYSSAQFYRKEALEVMLRDSGFLVVSASSTLIHSQPGASRTESRQSGHVAGAGFVCLLARKEPRLIPSR
jgi:ubiquinone/menaquinone biosynthesis C-methylase UbiE